MGFFSLIAALTIAPLSVLYNLGDRPFNFHALLQKWLKTGDWMLFP